MIDSIYITFIEENMVTILNILAIIVSPILAVYLSEKLRARNYKEKKKDEILEKLIAYRDKLQSPQFLSALNSLNLFYDNKEIKHLTENLYLNLKKGKPGEEIIVNLIQKVAKERGHNVRREEILTLFGVK